MKSKNEVEVTEQDIQRNLAKVENGEALDMPLAILDGTFKAIYNKETTRRSRKNEYNNLTEEKKEKRRKYIRDYYQRHEVKMRIKLNQQKYIKKHPEYYEKMRINSRNRCIVLSILREMYQQEFQEIKDNLRNKNSLDINAKKRYNRANVILKNKHITEFKDILKRL